MLLLAGSSAIARNPILPTPMDEARHLLRQVLRLHSQPIGHLDMEIFRRSATVAFRAQPSSNQTCKVNHKHADRLKNFLRLRLGVSLFGVHHFVPPRLLHMVEVDVG